jgi:hypothetical protein
VVKTADSSSCTNLGDCLQLTFLTKAEAAGILLGAKVPIILTSRSDSVRTRMASCALAVIVAHARRARMLEVSR